MAKKTKTDRTLDWIKDHKILSVVITIGIIIIAIATFTNSLQTIYNFGVNIKSMISKVFKTSEKCFWYDNSKKILVVTFRASDETENFRKDVPAYIEEKSKRYFYKTLSLSTKEIEIHYKDTCVQSVPDAEKILVDFEADVLIRGTTHSYPQHTEFYCEMILRDTLQKEISLEEIIGEGETVTLKKPAFASFLILDSLLLGKPYELLNYLLLVWFGESKPELARICSEKGGERTKYLLPNPTNYQFTSRKDTTLSYSKETSSLLGKGSYRIPSWTSLQTMMMGIPYLSYQGTIDYYERSLRIAEGLKDQQSELTALNNIAITHKSYGKYAQAIRSYNEILNIALKITDRGLQVRTLFNMSETYEAWQKYERALDCLYEILNIAKETEDSEVESLSLNKIAKTCYEFGGYNQSIYYYDLIRERARKSGNLRLEAEMLIDISDAYDGLGNLNKAIWNSLASLDIYKKLGDGFKADDVRHRIVFLIDKMDRG